MKVKNLLVFFFLFLKNLSVIFPTSFINDLNFIHTTLKENHPGFHNKSDPHFKEHLMSGYKKTLETLNSEPSPLNRRNQIEQYLKSFNDHHLRIDWGERPSKILETTPDQQFNTLLKEKGIIWISLPTFVVDQNNLSSFKRLLNKLPLYQTHPIVVFDLRGNRGGDSNNALNVARYFFGKKYVNYYTSRYNKNTSVLWRASQGNIAHMRYLATCIKNPVIDKLADKMQKSLDQGMTYYTQSYHSSPIPTKKPATTATSKVFVIIDQNNGSAALDFLDILASLPYPVKLIGQKTKANRIYMELRSVELPSRKGSLRFPIKMYINRPRGDNKPYHPHIKLNPIHEDKIINLICNSTP